MDATLLPGSPAPRAGGADPVLQQPIDRARPASPRIPSPFVDDYRIAGNRRRRAAAVPRSWSVFVRGEVVRTQSVLGWPDEQRSGLLGSLQRQLDRLRSSPLAGRNSLIVIGLVVASLCLDGLLRALGI
jgi:hypothetical protein